MSRNVIVTDKSTGRENTHKLGAVVKPVKWRVGLLFPRAPISFPLTGFLITGAPWRRPRSASTASGASKVDYAVNNNAFSFYGTATHFDTQLSPTS